MYALVDCNNFFVSCERVFNPSLNNRPVIVLSSNDGCVIARSNEAKAAGIPMGIPVFKVRQVIEKGKFSVFSAIMCCMAICRGGSCNCYPVFPPNWKSIP